MFIPMISREVTGDRAVALNPPPSPLAALRVVVSLGWVSRVTSLQLASLELLVACREASNFRLKVARKTPRRVWQAKFGARSSSECSGGALPEGRSERLILPRVTRMIYDRPGFDLDPGWALPNELVRLILGTQFGGEMEGVVWPCALESVVFWRRWVRSWCVVQRETLGWIVFHV